MNIHMQPIGVLHNSFETRIPAGWENDLAKLTINEKWLPALEGVEDFSHLIVLFWLHNIPRRGTKCKTHPQGRQDLPEVGIFATRSPYRPNPIGLQVVELVAREGNVLTLRGIDALDGSPVLDIKPYLKRGDCVLETRIPKWLEVLWGTDHQVA